ncbi:MAG: hypothetical protein ABIR64_05975 [Candidatus Limnocylindrales bacterium]
MTTAIPRPAPRRTRLGALIAALALGAAFAPGALAGGATVTRGDFHAFNGSDLPIAGHATMVRTADGRTIVTIHVEGLGAGVTYGSHVHLKACDDALAGVHYRFNPGGDAVPPNEIWPGPFTANSAGIGNAGTIAEGTAGESAVSVVIHGPTGPKIACADLG